MDGFFVVCNYKSGTGLFLCCCCLYEWKRTVSLLLFVRVEKDFLCCL